MYELDFTSDSSTLVTCGDDKKFKLWSTSTWSQIAGGDFDTGQKIYSCKFHQNGELIIGQESGYVSRVSSSDYTTITSNISYGTNIACVDVRWGTTTYIAADRNSKGYTSLSTSEIYDDSNTLRACAYSRTLDYFVFSG